LRRNEEKDFLGEQCAEGTEINWAINYAVVCCILMIEWRAYVPFIFNKNCGISLQPAVE